VEFSLEIFNRSARSVAFNSRRKLCLREKHGGNLSGHEGLKFSTKDIGGSATASFRVLDPGAETVYPARKEDAININYGLTRLWQGIVDDAPSIDNAAGELAYNIKGHCANYARSQLFNKNGGGDFFVPEWVMGVFGVGYAKDYIDSPGGGWAGSLKACPWINSSDQYISTAGPANKVWRDYVPVATSEEILNDMVTFFDNEYGVFPGIDGPDEVGCYPYWKPRTRNAIDWVLDGPGVNFEVDLSYDYINYIFYAYKDSGGATQTGEVGDAASRAEYTPGAYKMAYLNLTGAKGYLTAANALALAQAQLDIYKSFPFVSGTVTLPYAELFYRSGAGMQPAAFIKAWDNIRLPRLGLYEIDTAALLDNKTGLHVYATDLDTSTGEIKLQVGALVKNIPALIARSTNQ